MPKRSADSSGDEVQTKKAKTDDEGQSGVTLERDNEGNYYIDLGSMKRATISQFKGKAQVNVREYYTDKSSGELRPGKKGITLNAAQWDKFLSATDALSEKLKDVESGKSEPAPAKSEKKKEGNGKTKKTQKPAKKKKKADSESEDAEESDGDE